MMNQITEQKQLDLSLIESELELDSSRKPESDREEHVDEEK